MTPLPEDPRRLPVSGNRETASLRKAVRITPAMARAIDHARGDVSWSRWVKRAIETALREQEGKP